METRANYVIVGSVVLGRSSWRWPSSSPWLARSQLNEKSDTYYTYFTGGVAGLSAGSPVRYRGVPVGTVANIEIDPANVERIRVTLKLISGTPVKTDSVAALEMTGITGTSYVEITGGTQSSPALKAPDDQIAVIPSQNSSLASLEEDAPKLLNKLLEFGGPRQRRPCRPRIFKAINQMLENLRNFSADLSTLGPDAREATAGNLNQLVATANGHLPKLLDTLQQDEKAARDAAAEFRQVAKGIDSLIAETRGPLRDFTGNGLYEMTGLVTELRDLTATLTRVADRLDRDPQRYLFGGHSQGVDASRPTTTGIQAGGSR